MATVSSSLRLFDGFSGPLRQISQSLNMTISVMRQMATATNADASAIRTLESASRRLTSAEADLISATQRATNEQQRFNNSLMSSINSGNRLVSGLKNIAAAYLSIHTAQQIGQATLGGAMNQQKFLDMFIARTGSRDIGTAMFQKFKREAIAAGADISDALTGALSFYSTTKNANQITELNNIAKRLSFFDTTGQGLQGAMFSVKEAMSGDLVSLSERFNMGKKDIRNSGLIDFAKKGDIDGFIKSFNKLLETQSMGKKAFQTMLDSPAYKWQRLINNFKNQFAEAGQGALKAILPLIDKLNNAFQSENFAVFFDGLYSVLRIISLGFSNLFNAIGPTWNFVKLLFITTYEIIYNTGIILAGLTPVITGVAVAWGIYYLWVNRSVIVTRIWIATNAVASLVMGGLGTATGAVTSAVKALNLAFRANPIGFVISLVIGLITALAAMQLVTNGLRKVFSGAFGFIVDVAQNAMNTVMDIVNGAIRGLNNVTKFFADLLGVDAYKIQEIQYRADFSKFKAAGQDMIENYSLEDFKKKLGLEKAPEYNPSEATLKAMNQISSIGKVDEVGKIKDKVDISNEDLKMMRELAEMKNIQNFVTLTPTVQVQTGDINKGADIDTVVAEITKKLQMDVANSAKGVYNHA